MVRWVLFLSLALGLAPPGSAQLADAVSHENALAHYRQGEDLFHREQFEGAVTEFQTAIKFDPLLTIAHYELGQTFMAMHRYSDAVRAYLACRDAFEKITVLAQRNTFAVDQRRDDELRELKEELSELRTGPNNSAATRNLQILRLENQIAELDRMRQRNSASVDTPPELSLALGSAYFRSGDLPAAERQWKAAIAVNKRLGEAHNNLAALYAMTGRKQEAEDAVKEAERSGYKVNPQLKADIRGMR